VNEAEMAKRIGAELIEAMSEALTHASGNHSEPNQTTKHLTETSKFLSYVLRHKPEEIGIALAPEGWCDIAALITAATGAGKTIGRELLQEVVVTSDKKRFAISADGLRIRAVQGHSTDNVSLSHIEKAPPALLYHGTATRFLPSIREKGLLAGQRHHVHLSGDAQTAIGVGKRHGTPVVLKIDAQQMLAQGMKFFQAENGVWLTDHVPMCFIAE
jgi:putative RNA 2'-phosphotransferase